MIHRQDLQKQSTKEEVYSNDYKIQVRGVWPKSFHGFEQGGHRVTLS